MIIRVVSKNRPGYYWSIDEGIEGYLMQESELFRVINPSLEGSSGSVSFESVSMASFLVYRNRKRTKKFSLSIGDEARALCGA